MRNPGENSEARVEGETTSQACAREFERDDCASPPCKRLKQAVLHFSALSSSPSSFPVSSNTSISPQNIGSCDTSSEISKPTQTCEEKPRINGGLVTGAPSPPDVKEGSSKSQPIPDPAKVFKSLNLENGMRTASGQDMRLMSSVASPEAKSGSHMEDELMVVDQSPPPKINNNKVISGTPLLKSAEKQQRKEERERERQEKQRLRGEKLKEKQEAKAMKEKERLEAKRKREQEKQEKQAEKERKEKERAEKREQEERERMEKKAKRDEEKRKRDEEKNAKMEEKRKREAEKRSIEEEQVRKRQKIQQQQQEIFSNFFTKTSAVVPKVVTENNSRFKPFEIKAGMSLAPVIRKRLTSDTQRALDDGLQQQEFSELYLRELERRKPILKYTKRKLSAIPEHAESNPDAKMLIDIDENSNSSIEIIEPNQKVETKKWKLLQFHQNYRPAYFGTWRKKSRKISPKNPFKKDTELLDYEVDSDDEWEEEEPGESLSNSEGEDEADDNEENEDDDGFFVPHGYLSDDEGVEDEDVEGDSGENDEKEDNPENKKDQQLAKAKAWEAEMKRKCKPVKPIAVGCLWREEASLNLALKRFAACLLVDEPIDVQSSSTNSRNSEIPVDSLSSNNSGALYVPDEAMPDLIKLIHGNTAGLHKIMGHFRKQWTAKCLGGDVTDEEIEQKCPISKRQLEKKIQNIATKERRTDRLRWYVHNHVLASFHLENLVVADGLSSSDASSDATMATVTQNTNTPSIMQFVRPASPATHRDTSVDVKHNTAKIEPASAPCDSSTPMEVDSTSPSLNHSQPTQVSGSSSAENSQLRVENNLTLTKGINSQICNPPSTTAVTTTKKTEANTSLESSSGKLIETVCID